MNAAPSAMNVGLLFGLSFFLGLAFEDFYAHAATKRPGGIRTFPMLALAGLSLCKRRWPPSAPRPKA
jgi:hypothetical protein